ncbi:uncharacterized protein DNG_07853 [Cephalotrichum gorgonifer]|uniref:Secreted protein n=1 Tax=Cephalotrichum gorgonifer TaxID=2041049 RepID=A0AAE8N374_9PEZI|nr:uncharacterized protein DNG_07853 [Cephalotrichum gorgonifer]
MIVPSALTLFLGLAAAVPSPQLVAPQASEAPASVKVIGLSLLGTGCPAGTADVQIDATGELFEATFSAYEVLTGPNTRASDWRKNCKLTMNLEFDRGFQFAVMGTDMLGYAEIPDGASGFCKNTFSFTGQTSSGGIDKVDFEVALDGHYSGDFDLHADPGIFSWSPCDGSTAILNMNTQCAISPTTQDALIAVCPFQTPRGTGDEGEAEDETKADCEEWRESMREAWSKGEVAKIGKQVDHISGKLTIQFRLAWRPCPN